MSSTSPKPENLVARRGHGGLWIVEDRVSRHWWTTTSDGEDALITTDGGRIVKATTVLGKKIRAAVAPAKS